MDYSKTLNLPKTDFAMKANLPDREPPRLKHWQEIDLYGQLMRRPSKGKFVLHDGPPYANGHIHMGHALNKALKDFVVRSRAMMGYQTPYVPGWDCHGMPIENKVREEFRKRKEAPTREALRQACRAWAAEWVEVQKEDFKRLGVTGDWDHPYRTMDHDQVAREIRVFGELAEKGFIYRGLKPVMWCTRDETALAEAEIEYHDHVSPSIYVRFPLKSDPNGVFTSDVSPVDPANCYTIIWTTTPWTIPANTGVAVSPDQDYVVVRVDPDYYLVAKELLPQTMEAIGAAQWDEVNEVKGEELLGLVFQHPLFDRASRLITADYVTMDTGTGVVHTAPGHGREDYMSGVKWGLPIINPVSPNGHFTEEAGQFAGMRLGEGDAAVRAALRENGALLHEEEFTHSYPHCWRCNSPLIFRATVQWFMSIDHNGHREKALEDAKGVQWVPAEGLNRINAMVGGRPDWCLSRQRSWGVGIPVFICEECEEPLLKAAPINAVADLVDREGSDAWFNVPAEQILPAGTTCPKCGASKWRKDTDILDVWFDSGSTCRTVMEYRPELGFPADLYLEGSDQHRGWFNASLMVAEGTKGQAPFKAVVTNGWMLDEQGRTMSKSKGTGVSPQDIIKKHGADTLRLWVSSTDFTEDVKFGPKIVDQVADAYRKIRNTVRFLLSNLGGFDATRDSVSREQMREIDRWAALRLQEVITECVAGYNAYEFTRVYRALYGFCTTELSSFYLDVLKDRLYASAPNSVERRSAQTALYKIAEALILLAAPVLVFTAEEAWQELRKSNAALPESVHLALFPEADDSWRDDALKAGWDRVLALRDDVNKALEEARTSGAIGKPIEARVTISERERYSVAQAMATDMEALREALNVSQVVVRANADEDSVAVAPAEGGKCPRCWLIKTDIGADPELPEVCARCSAAISGMNLGETDEQIAL
ncbi:MAG TPA: isoleucine--tRNA ligase [Armatimonadota bacterium]